MRIIFVVLVALVFFGTAWAQSNSDNSQTLFESNYPILDPSFIQGPFYSESQLLYVVTDSVSQSIYVRSMNKDSLYWMDPTLIYSSNTPKRCPVGALGMQSSLIVFWQEERDGKSVIQYSIGQNGVWTDPQCVLQSEFSQSKPTVGTNLDYGNNVSLAWIESDSVVTVGWSPDSVYTVRRWKKIPTAHVANPIVSLDFSEGLLAWEECTDSSDVIQFVYVNDTSSIQTLASGYVNKNPEWIRGGMALTWSVSTPLAVNIWAATFAPWFPVGNQLSINQMTYETQGECLGGGGWFYPVTTALSRLRKATDFTRYHFYSWRWRFADSSAIVLFYPPLYPPTRKEIWSKDSLTLPIVTAPILSVDTMSFWAVWVEMGAGSWRLKGTLTAFYYSLGGVQPTNPPVTFKLSQNYPNPFNPSTTLSYGLPTRSHVKLQVYNLLGQVVADLVNNEQAAGWNQVAWNANVASGLYFYRLEAVSVTDPGKRFVDVKKMILLK